MSSTWASTWAWTQPSGAAPSEGTAPIEGVATEGAGDGGPQGGPPGPCGTGNPSQTIILMLAMFAVFYFLLIRPQQKKAKQHQAMLNAIQKGDEVITNGGLLGRVTGIADEVVTVEVSEKVRVRVLKSQVAGKHGKTTKAEKK